MNYKFYYKKDNGITLIALIITIIILLILAAVTLFFAFGNNGILTQTENSRIQTDIAREKELIAIEVYGSYGQDSPILHIDLLDYNVRKNIPNTITDSATEWPLKVTYTDSGRSYFVNNRGEVEEVGIINDIFIGETLAKDILIPNPDGATPEEKGPYVNYIDNNGNTILCRVLKNNSGGVEIISDDVLVDSNGDPISFSVTGQGKKDGNDILNNYAEQYRNKSETGVADSARAINSSSDYELLLSLDIAKASSDYWVYSYSYTYSGGCNLKIIRFSAHTENDNVTLNENIIGDGVSWNENFYGYPKESGFRPIFHLNYEDVIIESGTGTKEDPYNLKKASAETYLVARAERLANTAYSAACMNSEIDKYDSVIKSLELDGYEVITTIPSGSSLEGIRVFEKIDSIENARNSFSLNKQVDYSTRDSKTFYIKINSIDSSKLYVRLQGKYHELKSFVDGFIVDKTGTNTVDGTIYSMILSPTSSTVTMRLGNTVIDTNYKILSGTDVTILANWSSGTENFTVRLYDKNNQLIEEKTVPVSVVNP